MQFKNTREFAQSLDLFDQVRLLDIYPAREEAIEGITSKWLLGKLKSRNKKLLDKEGLADDIKAAGAPVIIMLGAGDIGEEVEKVKSALEDEN